MRDGRQRLRTPYGLDILAPDTRSRWEAPLVIGWRAQRSLESAGEEDRLPVVRTLVGVTLFAGPVGLGRADPVDRARRGGRGPGCRWCVLPRSPFRPATGIALPASGRDRRSNQAHRDRDRRHRHALREPALHDRRCRGRRPHRGGSSAARDQPWVTRAGHRWFPVLRLRAVRWPDRCRHGPSAHRGLPPGAVRCRFRAAQPDPDVPEPARPASPRAALTRAARQDLVGRGITRDRGMDGPAGH